MQSILLSSPSLTTQPHPSPNVHPTSGSFVSIAFDVLVGGTPFLQDILTVFVRLLNPRVVGDLSEEGYRTRYIFVCLGPQSEADEVWEIGRAIAILMSQEEWGQKVDLAPDSSRILSVIEDFMDHAVIVPQLAVQLDNFRSARGEAQDASGAKEEAKHRPNQPKTQLKRQFSTSTLVATPPVDEEEGGCCGCVPTWVATSCFPSLSPSDLGDDSPLPVALPMHLSSASRRMMAIQDLREESAQKRKQLSSQAHEQNIRFSPFLAERHHTSKTHIWTKKQVLGVLLVGVASLAIILTFIMWLGPTHPDHTRVVHHTAFVTQSAEAGGLAAVSRAQPMVREVGKDAKMAIFDLKCIVQAQPHYMRFESASGDDYGSDDDDDDESSSSSSSSSSSFPAVEIMLYAFTDSSIHDKSHSKACLRKALKLETTRHDEAELLRTIVLAENSAAGEKSCTMENGGFFELTSSSSRPVGVIFEADQLGEVAQFRVLLSGLLLCVVFACIMADVIHRTLAAMCGAFGTLLLLATMGYRASMETTLIWLNEGTLALLFGMMILVNLVSTTGVFEWIAIRALEVSRQSLPRLLVLLCLSCGAISAFLDNVTTSKVTHIPNPWMKLIHPNTTLATLARSTVLLLAPVTIELCAVIRLGERADMRFLSLICIRLTF